MRHFLRKSCWKSSLQVYFWLNIIFFFRFCWEWEGDIDSSEEFEFSECTCELQDNAQSRCAKWRCYEKGIHYVRPNIAFSALGVFVAWPIFFVYLQCIYNEGEFEYQPMTDNAPEVELWFNVCWGAAFMIIVLGKMFTFHCSRLLFI